MSESTNFSIVVAYHNEEQIDKFLDAWCVRDRAADFLILQYDENKEGCAITKNKGIAHALERKSEYICVLDDDCYPAHNTVPYLKHWAEDHIRSLQDAEIQMFKQVTYPPSRGTPYFNRTLKMRVAASMGFWDDIPDYDASSQLCYKDKQMKFKSGHIFGQYFPLCGMNLAFRASEWPWCQFINVPRFDDIWSGFLWQRHAYANQQCFSLNGPRVRHARQSNVFKNLIVESANLERNETLWQDIASGPLLTHDLMLQLYNLSVT